MSGKSKLAIPISMALLFALIFAYSFAFTPLVAEAVIPQSYYNEVMSSNKDWWADDKNLDIDGLKSIVSDWFGDVTYDFDNIDPVVVAVIDSGILPEHEMFSGKYDKNGVLTSQNDLSTSDFVGEYDVLYRDEDGKIIGANTTSASATSLVDDADNAHGSHVAGIVATLIHELDLEKYIKIMPIKAGYPSGGSASFKLDSVKSAVDFALSNGADVVNLSIEGDKYFDVVTEAMAEQAVFVASAGNSARNSIFDAAYPAASKNVIGVMNYGDNDGDGTYEMWSRSNYGSAYDICAPGGKIYSVAPDADSERYVARNGTSMASPFVAFGAALATLRYRANISQNMTALEIADFVRHSSSGSISYNGTNYPVLSLKNLAIGSSSYYANISVLPSGGPLTQTLGDVKTVNMHADILPNKPEGKLKYEWYADNELISTNDEASFTPKDEVGSAKITLNIEYESENGNKIGLQTVRVISVEYYAVTEDNSSSVEILPLAPSGEKVPAYCRLGDSLILEVGKSEFMDPSAVQKIAWYVNGKENYVGKTFEFTPEKPGSYNITAHIGEYVSPPLTINVSLLPATDQIDEKTIMIVAAAAISVAILVIAVAMIAKNRKRRRS